MNELYRETIYILVKKLSSFSFSIMEGERGKKFVHWVGY